MPSERTLQALGDILENAKLAQSFVTGLDYLGFSADRRAVYAVTRCLEIISEASRRLDDDIRARHPELPWRAIMGAGNIYRHDYDSVAEEFLWRTVNHSLAPLIAAVETELGA
jgi:uncharacterized protein with HEPN domain